VKVEAALDAGLSLGRSTLDALASDLANRTRVASNQLSNTPDAAAGLPLERIREQLAVDDVVLWSSAGHMIASAGQSRFQLNPERPSVQQLRNVRSQGFISQVEGLDDTGSAADVKNAQRMNQEKLLQEGRNGRIPQRSPIGHLHSEYRRCQRAGGCREQRQKQEKHMHRIDTPQSQQLESRQVPAIVHPVSVVQVHHES
jgi:hypothetical protein